MKVSTKARYGLRFLMDIATHGVTGNVTLKDAASRQDISEKYLWQIANLLKSVGLIRATSGSRGGYTLAKPPSSITLREIFAALEGDCTLVECLAAPTVCPRRVGCAAREVWKEVQQRVTDVMDSIVLSDIIARQGALMPNPVPEYVI